MESKQICPECGKIVESGGLGGLCPGCMMQVGMGSVDRTQQDPDQHSAPPFELPNIDALTALFPHLEIQEMIGRGGMGAVYRAHQRDLDRPVALKILGPRSDRDPGFAERFTREARALARLSHPNIVAVYEFGHKYWGEQLSVESDQTETDSDPSKNLHYFVMEFVDGPNLREVQQAGQLAPREALAIVPQICAALQFAHDEGVVHRDIKPENILLDQKGRVKIADFGLAKIVGRETRHLTLTQDGHVMGTPHYMAPEQVEHPHEVDHRADIYSLGVVFYEMLTGELPLGKFAPPSRMVQVDVRLDEVVLKTLEKKPEQRYQQVSQVGTVVQTIAVNAEKLSNDVEESTRTLDVTDLDAERKNRLFIPAIGLLVGSSFHLIYFLAWIYKNPPFFASPFQFLITTGPYIFDVVVMLGATQILRRRSYYFGILTSILAILLSTQQHVLVPTSGASIPITWWLWNSVFSLGNLCGLVFGIWSLVLLSKREIRDASRSKARRREASPDWRQACRHALWATAVHAVPIMIVGFLIIYLMPRYIQSLALLNRPIPLFTQRVVSAVQFVQRYVLPILGLVLVTDALILVLLSAYRGRVARRWWSIVVVTALLLIVGVMLVALNLPMRQYDVAQAPTAPTIASVPILPIEVQPSYIAELPQGGTLELLAVSGDPCESKRWWKPDGSPWTAGEFRDKGIQFEPIDDWPVYQFVLRATNLAGDADWPGGANRLNIPGSSTVGYNVMGLDGRVDPNLRMIFTSLAEPTSKLDLHIGVAHGSWKTLGCSSPGESVRKTGLTWAFAFGNGYEQDGNAVITISHSLKDKQIRVIALAKNGVEHSPYKQSTGLAGDLSQTVARFSDLRLAEVKHFELRFRPYHKVVFSDVSLLSHSGQIAETESQYTTPLVKAPSVLPRPIHRSSDTISEDDRQGPFRRSLPQGSIELLAVSGDPCETDFWWRPDGTPWLESGFKEAELRTPAPIENGIIRRFVIRGSGLEEECSWPRLEKPNSAGVITDYVVRKDGQVASDLRMVSIGFAERMEQADLRIGLAMGPWQTLAVNPKRANEAMNGVVFTHFLQQRNDVKVGVIHSYNNCEVKVVAIDVRGTEHAATASTNNTWHATQTLAQFRGLPLRDIRQVEFRIRDYHWVTFEGVALQPKGIRSVR